MPKNIFKNKISRRNFIKYSSLTAGGLAVAGMGSGFAQSKQAGSIEFWSQPYGDVVAWQQLMSELQSEFTDETSIKVQGEAINWDGAFTTWLLVSQGGAHPDIADMFWLYSHAGIGGGQYGPMPITQYKDQYWPDLNERFFEGSLQDVHYQNEFYGIPWRGDIRPLMYRTDHLQEAGFDRAPDTWEEITEYAKALTKRDGAGNVERWGFAFGSSTPLQALMPYYWQAGGEFMSSDGTTATLDNDAMRETLTWMRDLVWTHQVVSPDFMETSYDPDNDFITGKLAINGSVSGDVGRNYQREYPELDGLWDFEIPPMGSHNRASYSGAGYWGLLHGTERIEESLEWMSFLSRDENMLRLVEVSGHVSPNKNVMQSDFWTDQPWKLKLTETLEHAHTSQHPSPAWGKLAVGEPGGVLYDLFFDAVVKQEDMDAVIQRAQARMQEELDKV